jgi:hypothetical protein
VPRGFHPRLGQGLERDGLRGGEVQHVHRATAPHLAVHQLAAEGIARPGLEVHGHHVGVAHEAKRGRLGIAPLDTGHEARPAGRGEGLVDLEVEARALKIRAQDIGGPHFLPRGDRAVVDALVADELLQQLHRL